MSASKPQPRELKCSRCRHHGIVVPQKGHMRSCPFLTCGCWKCCLVTQRSLITARQRNLDKSQSKPCEGGPRATSSAPSPPAEPRPSSTSELPETAASTSESPLDLRWRPAGRGEHKAGVESTEVPPFTSREKGSFLPLNAAHFEPVAQTPPVPVPFRISGPFPSRFVLCPNVLYNVPWLPPVPAGFHSYGLQGPQATPHLQQRALQCPAPPQPPPVGVFFTPQPPPLPEPLQPPPPRQSEAYEEKLD